MRHVWLWVPVMVAALTGGCDRLFGVDVVSLEKDAPLPLDAPPGLPKFLRADHINPGGGARSVIASISAVEVNDLIVVAVCSSTTQDLITLTDSSNNIYTSSSKTTGTMRQADIYYAIAKATVSDFYVRVDFTVMVTAPDIRIAEYQNIRLANSLDQARGDSAADQAGIGSGSRTTTTGPLAVTNAPALLVFTDCTQTYTIDPLDPNYTIRVRTSPDGNELTDRVVSEAGTYDATVVTYGDTGGLVTNLAAFVGIAAP